MGGHAQEPVLEFPEFLQFRIGLLQVPGKVCQLAVGLDQCGPEPFHFDVVDLAECVDDAPLFVKPEIQRLRHPVRLHEVQQVDLSGLGQGLLQAEGVAEVHQDVGKQFADKIARNGFARIAVGREDASLLVEHQMGQ